MKAREQLVDQVISLREYRRLKINIEKHIRAYVAWPTEQNRLLIRALAQLAAMDFGVRRMRFDMRVEVIDGRVSAPMNCKTRGGTPA